jgi:hypothetical protein
MERRGSSGPRSTASPSSGWQPPSWALANTHLDRLTAHARSGNSTRLRRLRRPYPRSEGGSSLPPPSLLPLLFGHAMTSERTDAGDVFPRTTTTAARRRASACPAHRESTLALARSVPSRGLGPSRTCDSRRAVVPLADGETRCGRSVGPRGWIPLVAAWSRLSAEWAGGSVPWRASDALAPARAMRRPPRGGATPFTRARARWSATGESRDHCLFRVRRRRTP